PEGQRQDAVRVDQALKPLDGDEAIDTVEQRPELRGDAEISTALSPSRLHLKDDSDHASSLTAVWNSCRGPCGPDTSFKKMRSSFKMNFSRRAEWLMGVAGGVAGGARAAGCVL